MTLVPDLYYRAGAWEPFDVAALFSDPKERARLGTLAGPLTNDRIIADAVAAVRLRAAVDNGSALLL